MQALVAKKGDQYVTQMQSYEIIDTTLWTRVMQYVYMT